jgi:hypothetical protein
MYSSMNANISALLSVEDQGQVVANVRCDGHAEKAAWTVSAEEYRTVFEAAMTDFADQCGRRLGPILTGGEPR